jgi:hypothetical protein
MRQDWIRTRRKIPKKWQNFYQKINSKMKAILKLIFELTFIFFLMLLEKAIQVIDKDYFIDLRGFD